MYNINEQKEKNTRDARIRDPLVCTLFANSGIPQNTLNWKS